MGVLWLSTVPLTSGLVAVMFGPGNLGTLFGIVFFSHQVGAFLGVGLGGVAFERTGSFDSIWWAGIALAVVAAALHWPIAERPAPRPAAAPPPPRGGRARPRRARAASGAARVTGPCPRRRPPAPPAPRDGRARGWRGQRSSGPRRRWTR